MLQNMDIGNMLNISAFAFEIIGFSLALISVYYPQVEIRLEHYIDSNSESLRLRNALPGLAQPIAMFIIGALAFTLVLNKVGILPRFVEQILNWLLAGIILVIIPVSTIAFLVLFLLHLGDRLHPENHAIAGIGFVVAAIGLMLDFVQLIWFQ